MQLSHNYEQYWWLRQCDTASIIINTNRPFNLWVWKDSWVITTRYSQIYKLIFTKKKAIWENIRALSFLSIIFLKRVLER